MRNKILKTLYIITLEKIQKRYTAQWHDFFKKEFSKYFNVEYIDGDSIEQNIVSGAFLDFNNTNKYKSEQVIKIVELFNNKKIKDGDIFFFMDGWHTGIINLKYMLDLNNIKGKIFTYFHAGTWDQYDRITEAHFRKWAKGFEQSLFEACDGHFVATHFHKDLIVNYFKKFEKKIYVVGFPMDWERYINDEIGEQHYVDKENIVIFPHRIDKEKSPEVFDTLSRKLKDYKFIKTMEVTKTKKEYYELMNKAKVVFSANKQETFGIGTVEGMMLGVIPIVPNKLSYVEMYDDLFKYTSYNAAKDKIIYVMNNYGKDNNMMRTLKHNKKRIAEQSLNAIPRMARVMNK